MGQWKSKRGYVSDGMADIMSAAFKEIGKLQSSYLWKDGKRERETPEPRIVDLADAIEFSSFGIFRVELHPDAAGLENTKVSDMASNNFRTIPNRGQIQYEVCEDACMDQEMDTDEP